MGWKNFKERFNIQQYVFIEKGYVHVGSGYINNLIKVNMETGERTDWHNFIAENYPEIAKVSNEEILALLKAPDVFHKNITVYTYKDADIIEKVCEEFGWPHVTHDGEQMFENNFFKTKQAAVKAARESIVSSINFSKEMVEEAQKDLEKRMVRLRENQTFLRQLNEEYPDKTSK